MLIKKIELVVSRVLSRTVIHLGHKSPYGSSDLPRSRASSASASLFDLAPDRVYHAAPVTSYAVRSYRTISPLPNTRRYQAVYFLLHFPWTHAPQKLSGISLYGARTFLCTNCKQLIKRLPDQLCSAL